MSGGHGPGPASPSPVSPSDWVVRWAHLIPPAGRVLDLACGYGRHSRFLALRGHPVVACDRDPEALESLTGVAGVESVRADLEDGSPWPWPAGGFAGIVVANYLHRPLFPAIAGALACGGILIYETFVSGNERFGKPSNPQFLLRRDELLEVFRGDLVVAGYEQGRVNRPKPALVQRLCAVRGDSLDNKLEHLDAPGSVKIFG